MIPHKSPHIPTLLLAIYLLVGMLGCSPSQTVPPATDAHSAQSAEHPTTTPPPMNLSEDEWRKRLTPEQFHILREEGTERAFSGQYNAHYEDGTYHCAACGHPLFSSETKYDSRTGWPSFYQPLTPQSVGQKPDHTLAQPRTEVHCANCGGHLGHVFPDGPKPTGLRYCLNSIALSFQPAAHTD